MAFKTHAQIYEFGVMIGGASYYGDLNTQVQNKLSIPATSLSYRFNMFNKYVVAKSAVTFGSLAFDDALSSNAYQNNRNLSFTTNFTEFSEVLEFHFMRYYKGKPETAFTPYFFFGLGMFKFRPYRTINGEKFDLKALGTEGQVNSRLDVSNYSLTQFSFPFGLGAKYGFNKHFAVVAEFGLRKTTTDYLDDVSLYYPDEDVIRRYNAENPEVTLMLSDTSNDSVMKEGKQRGNNSKNDSFFVFGLSLTYTIHSEKCPLVY